MSEPYNAQASPQDIEQILPELDALAGEVFVRLDPAFLPTAHLVSVPVGPVPTDEDVCWYSAAGSRSLPPLAGSKDFSYVIYPDGREGPPSSEHINGIDWGFNAEAMRAHIAAWIAEVEGSTGRMSFVSTPIGTADYRAVALVLRIGRSAVARYGGIPAGGHTFIGELALAFLTAGEMLVRDRARNVPAGVPVPDPRQILQSAANQLLASVFGELGVEVPVDWFVAQMDAIAAATYERAENQGRLLLGEAPREALRINHPVPLDATRAVRKLLEMSSVQLALASDARAAWGLVALKPETLPDRSLSIDFRGRHRWELRYGNQLLMRVEAGLPDVPRPQMRREDFELEWSEAFGAPATNAERLWSIVEAAMRQRHGTLVVFSSEVVDEAARLSSASTAIVPAELEAELIQAVTSVDGAILVDVGGHCHAVGVILDGLVTTRGNTGRGARYNSTLRYIDTRACEGAVILAVIVSEDGSVEVVRSGPSVAVEGVLPL